MNESDYERLRHIYDLYEAGEYKEAFDYAHYACDTAIREEIPSDIWKKLGGTLTPVEEEIQNETKEIIVFSKLKTFFEIL